MADPLSETARGALAVKWWNESRPRRQGAPGLMPVACRELFPALFEEWLENRQASHLVGARQSSEDWYVYSLPWKPGQRTGLDPGNWVRAFHGTRWYAVWSILNSKVLLESNNHALGHDFWKAGVYCSPLMTTARSYAIPHELFGDGVYFRAMFEVCVDLNRRTARRAKGGEQWVFPSEAVRVKALWVQPNAPPAPWEWRFITWDEELEAWPVGQLPPRLVKNTWNWNLLTQQGPFFSRPPPLV